MLLAIGIILFILGALFFVTIILLADEKDFFKLITFNTLILLAYLFIAQKFALYFSSQDIFGNGKLWFLVICLSIQVISGFIHAIRRKRVFLQKKRQKRADSASSVTDQINE